MPMPIKALLAATALSVAVAAGAAPSQAGILDSIFGGGGIKITGNVNQTVNASNIRTSGRAKINAAVISGKVTARNVNQQVTLRNIAISSGEQNYAVIAGGK